MIKILDFEKSHIEQAIEIARMNYNEERKFVPDLPRIDQLPSLDGFAENGLGVSMFDDGEMIGFLCCHTPWDHAFGSEAKGTFSPIHAHGAIPKKRDTTYKKLYQAAAEKWVAQRIAYHSIGLYAHDAPAADALFSYGFGHRCVDAVRSLTSLECTPCEGITFDELEKTGVGRIREMRELLSKHLGESPCFMRSSPERVQEWIQRAETRDSRIFIAKREEKPVAFMEVTEDGENFATEHTHMKNICGAFCYPEYRGIGINQNLLNYVISKLRAEGNESLGVDFEGFNPTAAGFWLKYFTAYTKGVTRRIDECAFY